MPMMKSWSNLRKGYGYIITANQKRIVRQHKEELLTPEVLEKFGIDEDELFSIPLMPELDDLYQRKLCGFDTVEEFYRQHSACHYLHRVKIPLLLVNAEDDPLVPPELLEYAMEAAKTLPHCIFAMTKHGGHLGYFEHGFFKPNDVTWIDRLFVEFANAITVMHQENTLPVPMVDAKTDQTGNVKELENGMGFEPSLLDKEAGNGQAFHCNKKHLVESGDTGNNQEAAF